MRAGRLRVARAVLAHAGATTGYALVFLAATVGGVAIHANLPGARRALAAVITERLAPLFVGAIRIEAIGHVDPMGASGVRAEIVSADGRARIAANGVAARIDTLRLVRSLLSGGAIEVQLDHVHVTDAVVDLDTDERGVIAIAGVFAPKTPSPPKTTPSPGVVVDLAHIELDHAWARGTPAPGAPRIDADVAGLRARLHVSAEKETTLRLDVDDAALDARAMIRHLDPHGRVAGHLDLPGKGTAPVGGGGTFTGRLGDVPTKVEASFDGERLEAKVDVPRVAPEAVRAIVPEAPLAAPVAAHVTASGPLTDLATTAHVELDRGAADVDAHLGLPLGGAPFVLKGNASAHDVDLRALDPHAPTSSLGTTATFDLASDGAGPRGAFTLESARGAIAANPVPAAHLRGEIASDARETRLHTSGTVDEVGAPTRVDATLHAPRGAEASAGATVAFHVTTSVPDLRRIARVGPIARGSARADATGTIDLRHQTVHADVRGDVHALAPNDTVRVGHIEVRGALDGPLAAPRLDATAHGRGIDVASYRFARARVRATGDVLAPHVEAQVWPKDAKTPGVTARADLDARGPSFAAHDLHVGVVKRSIHLEASLDRLGVDHGEAHLDGLSVDGLGGRVHGSARVGRGHLELALVGSKVEIARAAKLFAIPTPVHGDLSIDTSIRISPQKSEGYVRLDVDDAYVEKLGAGEAHVEARVTDRHFFADVRAKIEQVGQVTFRADDFALAADPLRAEAWTAGVGQGRFSGDVDLASLARLVPDEDLPFGERRGRVSFEGSVGRDLPGGPPGIGLSARTSGLVLAGREEPVDEVAGEKVTHAPPWRLEGVDLGVDLRLDGDTGDTALAARAFDHDGALVSFDSKIALPYRELLAQPGRAVPLLEATPITARVTVPERPLATLPAIARTKGMEGTVALDLTAQGTAEQPNLALTLLLAGLQSAKNTNRPPVDARVEARYDGRALEAAFATASRGRRHLAGSSEVLVSAADLLHGHAADRWEATARLQMSGFPLDAIPAVATRRVRGELDGTFTLEHLHKDATLHVALSSRSLRIGSTRYGSTTVRVDAKDGAATLDARLAEEAGYAHAQGSARVLWGARLAPELDPSQPIALSLKAENFHASVAQPFVAGAVQGLDGRLDANVTASLRPGSAGHAPSAEARGAVTLTGGTLQVPKWGEELRDVQARVDVTPDGTVRLTSGAARPTSGLILFDGDAKLDGVTFREAKLQVRVPEKQSIPIGVEGVDLGAAWGNVNLGMRSAGDKGYVIELDVPQWHTQLAQTDKHAVQSLDANPDVHIGVHREGKIVVVPLSARDLHPKDATPGTPVTVDINLGRDVEIARGTELKVGVGGRTTLTVTDAPRMKGQLTLRNGTLDVQGRRFTIDSGTVTFVDDPTNPDLVVTAEWTAGDGTRVFADFVGPLKTGKVTLRSEPALSKNEILALILGSSTSSTEATSTTTTAAGAGGGLAAQGLNKAIDNLTGLDNAQFRVDTNANNNPRPQLDVQIARDISVGVATVLGLPPPDQPDQFFGTVEWRFLPAWSLQTMFGNLGSTLVDVIWRKRY